MFNAKPLTFCLLSFLLGQITCDQLVTTVPSTQVEFIVTVTLFGTAADNFITTSCAETTFSSSLSPKIVSSLFITELVVPFPSQTLTIDIPTTTVITTSTTKKYYNVVSTVTKTSYLKPNNCDYDNSSSEEEEEQEAGKMIGSRGLKKYIEELIAYKIGSKFKYRYNY